jgi:hypothetical protein
VDKSRKNTMGTSKDFVNARGGFFDTRPVGVDCTMGFCKTNVPGHFSMVNARHYDMHPVMNAEQNYRFLKACMSQQTEGGFERMRKNSSGPPKLNPDVLRGAGYYNTSPIKLNSSYLCTEGDHFLMMYVSPMPKHGKRKLCKHPYSNFKRGGSFAMPPEFVTRYPFLKEFAKAKIRTAQYLIKLYEISEIDLGDAHKNIFELRHP